jgi:hypothetical protein
VRTTRTDGPASAGVFRTYVAGQQALAEAVSEEFHVVIGPSVDKLQRLRPIGWYGVAGWSSGLTPLVIYLLSPVPVPAAPAIGSGVGPRVRRVLGPVDGGDSDVAPPGSLPAPLPALPAALPGLSRADGPARSGPRTHWLTCAAGRVGMPATAGTVARGKAAGKPGGKVAGHRGIRGQPREGGRRARANDARRPGKVPVGACRARFKTACRQPCCTADGPATGASQAHSPCGRSPRRRPAAAEARMDWSRCSDVLGVCSDPETS